MQHAKFEHSINLFCHYEKVIIFEQLQQQVTAVSDHEKNGDRRDRDAWDKRVVISVKWNQHVHLTSERAANHAEDSSAFLVYLHEWSK